MKTVLTIAGSDSSGGAGIQADIKTLTLNGVYAMSAVTALTAQNTLGVKSIFPSSPKFLQEQLDCVFEDIRPDAVKIGMVASAELIEVIVNRLLYYKPKNIVVDPVMIATSGSDLIDKDALAYLMCKLLPLSNLVTPNIYEAEILSHLKIESRVEMELAAKQISEFFGCAVLLKGGHCKQGADDYLFSETIRKWYISDRIENPNNHGTGCTLSSAIAAHLAKGYCLDESVVKAKAYVLRALSAQLDLGKGSGPLMHNFDLKDEYFSECI